MTTGIQCTADPGCRYPAPPETGICHEHRRQARLPRCSARRRRGCASPPVSSPGSASPTIKPNRLRKHQCGTPKHPGPPPSPAPPQHRLRAACRAPVSRARSGREQN
jgi:hypothetical protein